MPRSLREPFPRERLHATFRLKIKSVRRSMGRLLSGFRLPIEDQSCLRAPIHTAWKRDAINTIEETAGQAARESVVPLTFKKEIGTGLMQPCPLHSRRAIASEKKEVKHLSV